MPKLSTTERMAVFAAIAAQSAHLRGAENEATRLGLDDAPAFGQRACVLEEAAQKLKAVLS
jgi:hypothetical protein